MIKYMKDFIISALPFVIIGLCLAIIFTHYNKENKKNHLTEGMCIGMALGLTFATSLNINLALGISFGMLIGETIGILIEKK